MKKTDKSTSDDDLPRGTYVYGPDGSKHPKSPITSTVRTMRKVLERAEERSVEIEKITKDD